MKKNILLLVLTNTFINYYIKAQTQKMIGKAIYSIETLQSSGTYKENNSPTIYFNNNASCSIDTIKNNYIPKTTKDNSNAVIENLKKNTDLDSFQIEKIKNQMAQQRKILMDKMVKIINPDSNLAKQFFDYKTKTTSRTARIRNDKY